VRVVSPSLHVSNRKGSVFPRRGRILPFCIRRYSTLTRVSDSRFHKQNGGDVCCPVRLGTAHPSLLAVETRCRWAAYEEKPNLKLLLRCVGMGSWGGSSRKLHVSCPVPEICFFIDQGSWTTRLVHWSRLSSHDWHSPRRDAPRISFDAPLCQNVRTWMATYLCIINTRPSYQLEDFFSQ
jgi:hypothetical protein